MALVENLGECLKCYGKWRTVALVGKGRPKVRNEIKYNIWGH